MSDSDGDFSDELLELAGAGDKRPRKNGGRSGTTNKRRKQDSPPSDSDNEYESEEDANPYPLEGKYIDEEDKERLLGLSEIEREDILAQRQDELQKIKDRKALDALLAAQQGDVSAAAKRPHQARGATKEKTRKLDELKARRREKSEKKKTKALSPKRERSASPTDMEMSSEDEEDGQISKREQEEERESRLINKEKAPQEEPISTMSQLQSLCLPRSKLAKYARMPWFEEYVKGAWVRYLIGVDKGVNVYRVCEIISASSNPDKKYKIENEYFDTWVELKFGKSSKAWPLDRVSNTAFTEPEWKHLQKVLGIDKVKLPSVQDVEKKLEQFEKLPSQALTEADITAMLARRAELGKTALPSSRMSATRAALERQKLVHARELAQRRRDFTESAELDKQIAALDAARGPVIEERNEREDILAKVNERNRLANSEAIRRAEAAEAERKKKKWLARLAASRNPTPEGTPKLGPRLTADDGNISRSASPLPKSALGKRPFESVVDSVEIDLGDF